MSINPLELQTNFMQMNNVSKREALSKEQEILRQSHADDAIKKNENKALEDVPELEKMERLTKVDPDEEFEKEHKKEGKPSESEEETTEHKEKESVRKNNENGVGEQLDLMG